MRSCLISMLAALPLLAASSPAPAGQDQTPDFKAIFTPVLSSRARIYLPGDPEYFKVDERWSNLQNPSYVAAIQPATESDVKNIVSFGIHASPDLSLPAGRRRVIQIKSNKWITSSFPC